VLDNRTGAPLQLGRRCLHLHDSTRPRQPLAGGGVRRSSVSCPPAPSGSRASRPRGAWASLVGVAMLRLVLRSGDNPAELDRRDNSHVEPTFHPARDGIDPLIRPVGEVGQLEDLGKRARRGEHREDR
jgi:hypothetical protein